MPSIYDTYRQGGSELFRDLGSNPFLDYLEEKPEVAFFSHLYEQDFDRPKSEDLSGIFGRLQRQFLGQLGSQIRGGQNPTLRWNDWLGGVDWEQEHARMSPRQRGMTAPPTTRFLYR